MIYKNNLVYLNMSSSVTSNNKDNKIKNKGTGAGGANTNKNGLPYENLTDLNTHIEVIKTNKNSTTIQFEKYNTELEKPNGKTGLFKVLKEYLDKNIEKGKGCKQPDECYINMNKKEIFIIEKKFQQTNGSVDEKIQTPEFKIWNYGEMFPEFKIVYIYCLSNYFTSFKAELKYLELKKVPVFWGDSKTYKDDIIKFIVNYK